MVKLTDFELNKPELTAFVFSNTKSRSFQLQASVKEVKRIAKVTGLALSKKINRKCGYTNYWVKLSDNVTVHATKNH